jgi:predicted nucleic-acid-binding protein
MDTGALIALFSNNPSEKSRFDKINNFLNAKPHSPRYIVDPCLVELFYKVCQKDKLRPKDVETNLLYFAIEIFDIPSGVKHDFLNSYFKVGQNKSYDYADYFLCRAALRFPESSILTIDKRDLPLA